MGYLVTTPLYPVDVQDLVQQNAPDTLTGAIMPTAWTDAPAIAAPLWPAVAIVQTYFPHPYDHGYEAIQQSIPNVPSGLLGPTYFPHPYDHGHEAIQQAVPDTPGGTLEQTVVTLDYDHGFESIQQSAPDTPTGTLA